MDVSSPESRPLVGHGEGTRGRKDEVVMKGAHTVVWASDGTLLRELSVVVATI